MNDEVPNPTEEGTEETALHDGPSVDEDAGTAVEGIDPADSPEPGEEASPQHSSLSRRLVTWLPRPTAPASPGWRRHVGQVSTAFALLGGVAACAQLALHWITDGNGSTFDGRGLAGNLISGRARPSAGPLGGAGILVIAVLGAAIAATSTARSRTIAAVRATFGLLVALGLVTAATAGGFTLNKWGAGPVVLTTAGSMVLLSGLALLVVAPRLDGRLTPHWFGLLTWALGGVGVIFAAGALLQVSAGKEEGWSTPEAAAEAFLESLDNSDVFAALQSVSPLEARGIEEALRELETRMRQAPTATTDSMSLDLEIRYGALTPRKLAPGVIAVRSDVDLSLGTEGLEGNVAGAILRDTTWSRDDFDIVTVFEDGGWWVSPMLTTGKYLSWEFGLATGDYDVVRDPRPTEKTPSDDITGSLESMGEGISRSDPDKVAAALDPGARRLVNVFSDAIADLLDEMSESLDLTVDSISVDESPDGTTTFETLDVSGDGRGFKKAEFETCSRFAAPADTVCILDGLPLTTPLTLADLPLHIYDDGERQTLDLLPTVIDWAGRLWSRVHPSYLVRMADFTNPTDVLQGQPVEALEFGVSTEVQLLDGEYFRVFELTTEPGQPISISLDRGDSDGSIGIIDGTAVAQGDIGLENVEGVLPTLLYTPVSTSVKVLVVGDEECNEARVIECRPVATQLGLLARQVQQVTLDSDALITPELGPSEIALVTFTAGGEGRYEITTTSPEVEVSKIQASGNSASPITTLNGRIFEFEPGEVITLVVRNISDTTQSFPLGIVEAPLPLGFLYNGRTSMEVTVSIANGRVTVPLQFRPGMKLTVLAFPSDLQDIILDGTCPGCDYQDVGYGGDREVLTFYTGDSTGASITVGGYSSYYDAYRTVTLVLRIDEDS